MTEIKRPKFEKPKGFGSSATEDRQKISPFKRSLDIGNEISLRYEGITVIVKIEKKVSDNKFTGLITGFEPPMEKHKDLSVNERVRFVKGDIRHIL